MKIPNWFVVGCGLLVLNLVLVLGGTLSRYASAESPDDVVKTDELKDESEPKPLLATESIPPTTDDATTDAASRQPTLPSPGDIMPTQRAETLSGSSYPSIDSAPLPSSGVATIQEIESHANTLVPRMTPMVEERFNEPKPAVPEQLSHSYFEAMQLRLRSVEHLNQAAIGLIEEAAILYQRGEIAQSQKLIGIATQLRETAANLLVSHQ